MASPPVHFSLDNDYSTGAAYMVGYFDGVAAMEKVYDQYKEARTLALDGGQVPLNKRSGQQAAGRNENGLPFAGNGSPLGAWRSKRRRPTQMP